MSDQRLRRPPAIRAVMTTGARAHSDTAVVHTRQRADDGPACWTVVAGRKVGSAVARNRAKRRLRAVLRAQPLPAGVDIVAVARSAAVGASYAQVEADVTRALRRGLEAAAGARS